MPDNAALFHLVHDARSSCVAELETALQHGHGRLPGLQNHLDRSRKHFVAVVRRVGCSARIRSAAVFPTLGSFLVNLRHHLVGIVRRIRTLDEACDLLHLVVGDEAALHALRLSLSQRCIEHIALADELFSAVGIQNDTRLHCRRNRKRNTRRDVRLHQTRNDVRRRTLRRDNQVHACRTTHLRHAADRLLNFLLCHQHQICQLVNDDDNLRHGFKLARRFRLLVIRRQIAHALVCHQTVAPHHFRHCPLQRACRLLGVGHDRNQQVRNAVVHAQLDHFGVDHDELDLFRLRLIQKRDNERIHAHRLAGTGCTGNEQVRQLSDIADDAVSADVLTDSKRHLGFAPHKLRRIDHIARQYRRHHAVRHLNADHGDFLRNCRDADARRAKRQRNIVCQIGHFRQLHAPVQLQLIARDGRTPCDVDDCRLDAEGLERIAQPLGVLPHFLGAVVRLSGAFLQQLHGRILICRRLGRAGNFLRNCRCLQMHIFLFDFFLRLGDCRRNLRRFCLCRYRQFAVSGNRRRRNRRGRARVRHMDAALRFGNRLLLRRFRFFRFGMQFLARLIRHDKRHRIAPQFVEIQRRQLLRKRLLLLHILFLHLRIKLPSCGALGKDVRSWICLFRFLRRRLHRAAAFLHEHIRAHGRFSLSGLCLLHRQRRLVHWKIKLRRLRAAALLLLLHMFNVPRRNMVDNPLGRVRVLQLRLVVFNSGAVFDRGNNSAHRHIQARDQLQRQRGKQHNHSARSADNQLQRLRKKPGDDACTATVQSAVPEVCQHGGRPVCALLPADELHQRADGHGKQHAARHAQRDGSSVMQQQNQKTHHERKRQYV